MRCTCARAAASEFANFARRRQSRSACGRVASGTLNVDYVLEPLAALDRGRCVTHPQTVDGAYALADHLHPVYRIATAQRLGSRAVLSFRRRNAACCPHSASFTGGARDDGRVSGEGVFVVAHDKVIEVPR